MFLDQEFPAGRSDYFAGAFAFAKASAVALYAMADTSDVALRIMVGEMADDSAGLYCAKMLRKRGVAKKMCHTTKRTHRFWQRKHGLSDCEASRSDGNFGRLSVGSFWKTNPPGECSSLGFGLIFVVSECFRNSPSVKMLRTCGSRKLDVECWGDASTSSA